MPAVLAGEPSAHAPSVSVVICAYTLDRWSELQNAVRSVSRQSVTAADVVVVIDQSPELLAKARAELTGVTVVPNDVAPGLAGARNAGIAVTSGEVVAFLDDDAEAAPMWIEELQRGFEAGSALGVGGQIDPEWSSPPPAWFPEEFNWVLGCTYRGMPVRASSVRNLIGANMSAWREVIDAAGGFNNGLGRLEETEFCIRARQLFPDRDWVYWPSASVRHHVSPARTSWTFFRQRCFNEGVAKASMVEHTDRESGLASERTYATRALPAGVARGLRDGLEGDLGGFTRAIAIVVGLAYTTAGYAAGRIRLRRQPGSASIPRRGASP